MRGFRVTPLIIAIVGTVLCLAAGALLFFLMVKPTTLALAAQQERVQEDSQYLDGAGQLQLKQAQAALVAANVQAQQTKDQWNNVQTYLNPNIDVSDRFTAWKQWINELEFDFAPRLQKFLNHGGVVSMTKITAPAPPADPNAVPTTLISMPLGTISVFGSYNKIMNHVAGWNNFTRIVLLDKLALTGYSPFITGTYSATEYIFPRNSDAPGPPVPSPTGGTAAVAPGTKPAASATGAAAPGAAPPGAAPGAPGAPRPPGPP